MVEGVQVTLPSYEEAVSGGGASTSAESRVQIVLSEGQNATVPEAGPSRPSYLKPQQSEMAVVHPVPLSSSPSPSPSPSPSSSTWVLEHAGAAAPSYSQRRPSAGSDQHNLSLDSEMDYSDGKDLATLTFYFFKIPELYWCNRLSPVYRYTTAEGNLKNAAAFRLCSRRPALLLTCTCEWDASWVCQHIHAQIQIFRVKLWVTQNSSSDYPKGEHIGVHVYIHAYMFL